MYVSCLHPFFDLLELRGTKESDISIEVLLWAISSNDSPEAKICVEVDIKTNSDEWY